METLHEADQEHTMEFVESPIRQPELNTSDPLIKTSAFKSSTNQENSNADTHNSDITLENSSSYTIKVSGDHSDQDGKAS